MTAVDLSHADQIENDLDEMSDDDLKQLMLGDDPDEPTPGEEGDLGDDDGDLGYDDGDLSDDDPKDDGDLSDDDEKDDGDLGYDDELEDGDLNAE